MADVRTLYDWAGGDETIRRLVEVFYSKIPQDEDLAPIFPEDLTEIRHKQYLFLTQFFGGPPLFSQAYGAPMLRARHLKVPITRRHARAWLRRMSESLQEIGISGPLYEVMMERLTRAGMHMVNTEEEDVPAAP
ncbi:globin [Alicyclobacillus sp.]|uniref:globin domain-containing protein n=1 Tax=Alicyclobacillus sp. TaxID=61169 RepID=UPI0025C6A0CD|nr:globin [Alicyclobacillus sp.]MCL6517658.1 globin [Alicyclobacillus sp.]